MDNFNGSGMNTIEVLINLIVHVLLFGVTGFITYKAFENEVVLLSWHPSLMAIGVRLKICYSKFLHYQIYYFYFFSTYCWYQTQFYQCQATMC